MSAFNGEQPPAWMGAAWCIGAALFVFALVAVAIGLGVVMGVVL